MTIDTLHYYADLIITFGGVVGAIVVVIQSTTKYNPLNKIRHWFIQPVDKKIDSLEKNIDCVKNEQTKLRIDQLRLIVSSEDMPLSERVKAGDEYVNKYGENGAIKAQYSVLRQRLENQYKGENYDNNRSKH